jgi:hypothetical protein
MIPKVEIIFFIVKEIIETFGIMSVAPVQPELPLCRYKCGECSIKCTCATQAVLGLLT